ncbi:hypothetical protein REPUB_Repub16aG0025100 [Reevesia pubescens]
MVVAKELDEVLVESVDKIVSNSTAGEHSTVNSFDLGHIALSSLDVGQRITTSPQASKYFIKSLHSSRAASVNRFFLLVEEADLMDCFVVDANMGKGDDVCLSPKKTRVVVAGVSKVIKLVKGK